MSALSNQPQTSPAAPAPSAPAAALRLRAVVLLAGTVRPGELSAAAGCSLLNLPLDEHQTLLDHWYALVADMRRALNAPACELRVTVNRRGVLPRAGAVPAGLPVRIEHDLGEYRGTAGVLRDLALDYQDDDRLMVLSGAQLLRAPLAPLAEDLARGSGDIGIVAHHDGTPSGAMLVRCGALRDIRGVGYVDMKEQALPAIARRGPVRVLARPEPTGLPIRRRVDYLAALRWHYRRRAGLPCLPPPFAEDWQPTFALIQSGAQVALTARVHDAVVLAGGVVGKGAVVVRSVVGPAGRVPRGARVVDQVLGAPAGRGERNGT